MQRLGPRLTLSVASVLFFALGLITAAIGPALPELAERTGGSLATLGGLFTALFLGALASMAVAGPLMDRFGQGPVLLAGALLLAVGTAGVAVTQSVWLVLGMGVFAGLGHGAVDIGGNVLIARVFAGRSVAALNLLNLFFGVGAIGGPAIAGLTMKQWNTALPGLWAGVALLLAAAPFVALIASGGSAAATEQAEGNGGGGGTLFRSPLLYMLGGLLLLYVGVENGVAGWTTAYLSGTTAMTPAAAALVTSGFWLALTLGRLIAVVVGNRLSPEALLRISLTGGALGGVLLVAGHGTVQLSVAAVLVLGLSFGPIFPTTLAITTARFAHAAGTASSVAIAMASVGGMVLPYLQGVLMENVSPWSGLLVVLGGTIGMLGLHLLTGAARRPVPATTTIQ